MQGKQQAMKQSSTGFMSKRELDQLPDILTDFACFRGEE